MDTFNLRVSFRKRAINYSALLRQMNYKDKASHGSWPPCILSWSRCVLGEKAKTHRMPYLCRSFSAKEPYNSWLFCGKRLATLSSLVPSASSKKMKGMKANVVVESLVKARWLCESGILACFRYVFNPKRWNKWTQMRR